ncbi:hypothetical protein FOMPIDRAFT_90827 [Fomitopsis schrenkii]|uniref:DUF6533 domain-containing protein n=1 Tax=Fomitopsis schrenkii TaxID=2126942 RepID=S8FFK1_FOMSC|nr:hypothetical protein FOMPIDRAFT_90827 [Fomitopsis schrenkii]
MANPQPEQVVYQLDSELVRSYLLVAPFALYVYDRLITITREVDLVWGRPGQRRALVVPALYGLMHIYTPLYFVLNITTLWNLSCKRFVVQRSAGIYAELSFNSFLSTYFITVAFGVDICLLYTAWGMISALRVYAINPRDWTMPFVVFGLFLVPVAANLLYAPTRTNAKFAPLTCNAPLTVEISTRVSAIAGDALVLFATWRVTYGVSRVSHLVKPNIPITLLLLRDGTLYFGALLILNIFSAVCWAKIPTFQDFDNFIYSLTTILLSRLFFNLREVSPPQSTLQDPDANSLADGVGSLPWTSADSMQTHPSFLSTLGGSLMYGRDEVEGSVNTDLHGDSGRTVRGISNGIH